ncbi:MAG TPA: GtrA family protein [Novosphingobium sp.]|nr:GtrA family protein [Novosphingobium sp.]
MARESGLYLFASLVALGADMACFMLLLHAQTAPWAASALAYGLGVGAHWALSARLVFAASLAPAGMARRRQQGLFAASALAGLALTSGIVGAGAAGGLDPRLAKGVAVGVSFLATWALRRLVVFARPQPAPLRA